MKKKTIIILIAAFLVLLCAGGFFFLLPSPKLNADDINQIQFASYPAPPMKKILTEKEDIQKFVSAFNELHLTPRLAIAHATGTSVFIKVSGKQTLNISMMGSTVDINAMSYRCSVDASAKFRELYQTYALPEEKY